MRYFRHYLPFFIITTALYAAVFYQHQEVTVLTPQPLNSGQQTVQLQFINKQPNTSSNKSRSELKKEKKQPTEKLAARKEQKTAPRKTPPQKSQQQTAILTAHSKNSTKITAAAQKLQKSIRETTAKHDALLKAEFFTEEMQQDPRITENSSESPAKKKPVSATSAKKTKKLAPAQHGVNEQIEQQHKKNKRIFKKKPTADNAPSISAVKKTGVLQEALVVSGNIPTYPKRAILRNLQGRVVVQLTVNINGIAEEPQIITSSGHAILDKAVLGFIAQERFMPAHRGIEKVSSRQIFSFRFELN